MGISDFRELGLQLDRQEEWSILHVQTATDEPPWQKLENQTEKNVLTITRFPELAK